MDSSPTAPTNYKQLTKARRRKDTLKRNLNVLKSVYKPDRNSIKEFDETHSLSKHHPQKKIVRSPNSSLYSIA